MDIDLIRIPEEHSGAGRSALRLYEGGNFVNKSWVVASKKDLDYVDYIRLRAYFISLGHQIIGFDLLFADCPEIIRAFKYMSLEEMDLRTSPEVIQTIVNRMFCILNRHDQIKLFHCLGYKLCTT